MYNFLFVQIRQPRQELFHVEGREVLRYRAIFFQHRWDRSFLNILHHQVKKLSCLHITQELYNVGMI